jgi:hypothetical protein
MKQATIDRQHSEALSQADVIRQSGARREAALRERLRRQEDELEEAVALLNTPPPHPKEHLRAAIRVEIKRVTYLELRNNGELEALKILIAPIEDDGYPWRIVVQEISSLPAQSNPRRADLAIQKRRGIDCEDCDVQPHMLVQYCVGAARHRLHAIQQQQALLGEIPDHITTEWFVRATVLGAIDHHVPLVITYDDELARTTTVTYRLDISIDENRPISLRPMWVSQSEPTRAANN